MPPAKERGVRWEDYCDSRTSVYITSVNLLGENHEWERDGAKGKWHYHKIPGKFADDLAWAAPAIREASSALPGWQFVFWGYANDTVRQAVSGGCQFCHVGMSGVASYMRAIAGVNPQVLIVPLQDNAFNRAKSNIAWIEATYAGAVTVAPQWEQWQKPGVWTYRPGSVESFAQTLKHAMGESPHRAIERNRESWNALQVEGLLLGEVNEQRFDLLNNLKRGT